MCIAQFIPNIQNFAEAAGSGVHVLDIIDRVRRCHYTYQIFIFLIFY